MLTLVAGPHSYPGTTPMATPSQKLPMRIPSYSYHLRGSNTSRPSNMCHNDDEGEGPSAPAIPQRQRRRRRQQVHSCNYLTLYITHRYCIFCNKLIFLYFVKW